MSPLNKTARLVAAALVVAAAGASAAGCSDDRTTYVNAAPIPTTPARTVLDPREDLPGLNIVVVSTAPGSSPTGNLQAGDAVAFTFRLERDDGTAVPLAEVESMGALFSGPTDNYQLVLPLARDVKTAALDNQDGTYTYTFAAPIPATYPAPLNDTTSFGLADGELQGQPLRDGTYTLGLEAAKDYTIEGLTYRDAASTVEHVLFGSATQITARAVVGNENCSSCHTELQAHGGTRLDVNYCVLCHTSGAEDKNTPSAAGGTPGVTIDFRVLVHRIHAGATLPSVLGVTTRSSGDRDYAATPRPYQVVGYQDQVHDYSKVRFPSWPHLTHPMPRDEGWSSLTPAQQALENTMRSGVTSCAKCHGDPDGAGPLGAPAQGQVAQSQPTRRSCGSCHDDVVWNHAYKLGSQNMPAQADDASCVTCHAPSGDNLAVVDGHRHPMLERDPGVVVNVLSVVEAGANDADSTFDPGEKVQVTFTVRDAAGGSWTPTPATIQAPTSVSFVLTGPLTNRNLLLGSSFPITSATIGSQPFVRNLPEPILLELVGRAASVADVFTASRGLFYASTTTTVRERTATITTVGNGATSTTAASAALDNRLAVLSVTGFAAGNFVVIDDGLPTEEYVEVGLAESGALQVRSALRFAHAANAAVNRVTLTTRTAGTHFTLTPATGTITEGATPFGTGNAIVVSYTTDYVVPATFAAAPFNDSPDFDETWGEWKGKALVSGTYQLGLWARGNFIVSSFGTDTSYPSTSRPAVRDLSFGAGPALPAPPSILASVDTCYSCHDDMWFHGGGRRGVETCLMCHATAGSEDLARFRSPTADATPGVTIDFRTMLHRIHRGKELTNAATYGVVGNGPTTHYYDEVGFPAMPGGTRDCAKCHGSSTRWTDPVARDHPTQQGLPTRSWRAACTSCHDSSAAAAHADAQTALGVESCAVCHGPGTAKDVQVVHKPREPR